MERDSAQRCGQRFSLYDWDLECEMPTGHLGRHQETNTHQRYLDGDEPAVVPVRFRVTWEDA